MDDAAAGVDPLPGNSSAVAGVEDQQEESGWTDYLEDYFSSEIEERENSFLCSSIGSCSWDNNDINDINVVLNPNLSSVGEMTLDVPNNKLTFKKTRTQKIFQDDSLEDTATSPIHSPKVADLKVRTSHVNPRFDDHITISSSTGSAGRLSENYYSNTEKAVYSAAELKKKGLCLFPLSMLLNYHD